LDRTNDRATQEDSRGVRSRTAQRNDFVAYLEMHGKGTFFDPRLDNKTQFPVAAKARLGHTSNATDLITSKLAALHFYQLAIAAPAPPRKSFDEEAAERGKDLFDGIGPDKRYRTTPLNALWTHTKGGFYHDGRFASLREVVEHYDGCFSLGLRDQDKWDLVEFLKSLPARHEDE
jgi:hypothetical protein